MLSEAASLPVKTLSPSDDWWMYKIYAWSSYPSHPTLSLLIAAYHSTKLSACMSASRPTFLLLSSQAYDPSYSHLTMEGMQEDM